MMTDAELIVDQLVNTEGIHAFVFVCENADKYLPMFQSMTVLLDNAVEARVIDLDPEIEQRVELTKFTFKREDRIIWALRFFKKALIEQVMWLIQNNPKYFKKKFRALPQPVDQQRPLLKQLSKLGDVDLSRFMDYDPDDPALAESPVSAFVTIDTIIERLEPFIKQANTVGAKQPANPIHALRLDKQSFGEVLSAYRRGSIMLRHLDFKGAIQMYPGDQYDLRDNEGCVETLIDFPDGWKWVDLHRAYSQMRDDRTAPSDIAITGHCANTAGKSGLTALELLQPLGNNKYKHQAFFVLHANGQLGERKGRKNQKPSPRLEPYIFQLLRKDKRIQRLSGTGHMTSADFHLNDLTKPHQDILKRERPELFQGTLGGEVAEDE